MLLQIIFKFNLRLRRPFIRSTSRIILRFEVGRRRHYQRAYAHNFAKASLARAAGECASRLQRTGESETLDRLEQETQREL
jgi:hypothetical protein